MPLEQASGMSCQLLLPFVIDSSLRILGGDELIVVRIRLHTLKCVGCHVWTYDLFWLALVPSEFRGDGKFALGVIMLQAEYCACSQALMDGPIHWRKSPETLLIETACLHC